MLQITKIVKIDDWVKYDIDKTQCSAIIDNDFLAYFRCRKYSWNIIKWKKIIKLTIL